MNIRIILEITYCNGMHVVLINEIFAHVYFFLKKKKTVPFIDVNKQIIGRITNRIHLV